ncbi:TetR/AcrR family transcriptional regulator [Nocardia sp. CDC160]|uniref:TetR/AcrR family transcriptional regulator n=1 Tax=Nocardia sp. CDC160 TaxID=3112166 RepID=UPI002DBB0E8E|nr:TetR/AcrR family transcriptional regulator [Nocardia sp. CDC160]MEC3914389.1 TetR/AcrR family transcriptional regulator [Nocardia sp. CDC160]
MPTTDRPTRTGGRVRSQDAHDAVLAATAELLEEIGYRRITMEGVAQHAKVAKSTIYRWWKSKPELVMEAYRRTVEQRMPIPDTGDIRGDLTEFTTGLYGIGSYPVRVKALRGLMAEAQLDPAFAVAFEEWAAGRRAVVIQLVERGVARGQVSPEIDAEYTADQVFGVFWYRLLTDRELDPEQAGIHVDRLLAGLTRR